MDLRQLNTFQQVADLGSLSKASDRLRIAQPALSRQMRLLEEELKVPLFVRHGRGMVLTPAGEMLRERVSGILRQIEETRADLLQEADAVRGRVILGVPPTVGDVLATRLIERFLQLYPEVRLRVVTAFSGYLLDWLHSGELDVAVVYGSEQGSNIRFSPLLMENLYLITRAGGESRPHHAIPFAELVRHQLILPGPQHGLRILVEREAGRLGLALRIPVEADALQILKGLVARGLGATVLPLAAVHEEVSAGLLGASPVVDPHLSRKLVVARPQGRRASKAVQRFEAVLRQEVAAMVEERVWEGRLLEGDRISA
ncbi:LysR substrate-binding domain-containing protein [Roseomonas sp. OT10]|uniref:LysR family transcriptional regulator n=1 Tax=Roseomonas cutis TaxID=2897332 RepID=UPI001E4FFE39|nr:LysR substrate-binding domain-containing protein [Roseomonas sp. OT10]UFN48384.1 LysR substrate-binding domain-containing protein [Roseomonas sp. OT10]